MAERIPDEIITPAAGRGPSYPWSEWTDGSQWKVTQGDDFSCKPTSFLAVLSKQASLLSKKVVADSPTEGVIRFRFEDRPPGWVPTVRKSRKLTAVPDLPSSVSAEAPEVPSEVLVDGADQLAVYGLVGHDGDSPDVQAEDDSPDW